MDTITGTIERITFYSDETGYTVLRIKPDQKQYTAQARDGTITVVGIMPELGEGENVQFSGQWIDDAKYGRQFRVETVTPIQPTSKDGILRYLSSGIVKGIGEATARKIVDHFGEETIDILNHHPERLEEVHSLKKGLAGKLARAWSENVNIRQTMIFLQQYGVSSRMATRIYNHFGAQTIDRVKKDPYELADEVYGIGFIKADQIAQKMGVELDARERLRAGIYYALNKLAGDGHVFAPRPLLLETACELLKIDTDNQHHLSAILDVQLTTGKLVADDINLQGEKIDAIYHAAYFNAETGSAQLLRRLINTPSQITGDFADVAWPSYLADLAKSNQVSLSEQQQSAVKIALSSKVSILTGGPGTGKTTTLQMVINALLQENYPFALASPTGRAAKRLQEATGQEATTIHRLLGYSPSEGGFERDEDQPLDISFLIVDEASMLDLFLFHHLLKALKPDTHLMLVGDVDQLPSVGAGNVLRDLIDSHLIKVTRLELIFRQSEDSHIVVNAHRINQGEMPFMDNQSRDFFFFGAQDAAIAGDLVVDIVRNRLPRKYQELTGIDLDPVRDIQVISPMYRGTAGVHALNEALQATLNPNRNHRQAEQKLGGRVFRIGDKVMQTRNNYEKGVFNGDIGFIQSIDDNENLIYVLIDNNNIEYDYTEAAEDLIHAYCISTHRSQGSEYPVIVMPLLGQHYMMLQRNLLYTAITRAKRMVVLVGERKAVGMAVNNNKVSKRFTGLVQRLTKKRA